MALVKDKESNVATDVLAPSAEEPENHGPGEVEPRPHKHSFFAIYKKGQGYWTRMGTALGATLLIVVFAVFVFQQSRVLLNGSFYTPVTVPVDAAPDVVAAINAQNRAGSIRSADLANKTAAGATAGVVLVGGLFCWRLMNKPRNVDFLIATDVEMKKVNWTSRGELLGSTRIVIVFMFMIALILFLIDVGAGLFFQIIGLLKFGPLS